MLDIFWLDGYSNASDIALKSIAILNPMSQPRTLPLFDPDAHPQSWSERMVPGEYAVHGSSLEPQEGIPEGVPYCTVFGALAETEQYATQQAARIPTLRCRIYDHHGLGRELVREIRGSEYKEEKGISARFRRWCGSILFFGGIVLTIIDWHADFGLLWPAMFGVRMIPVGIIFLLTELVILIEKRRLKRV